jgi:hypothetical protein
MNPEPFKPTSAPPSGGASAGNPSPLGRRVAHFRDRDWADVVRHNRAACERECAQHGPNPETQAAVALAWAAAQAVEQTLGAALDFLRECQERSPFLFENAATFAAIGRELVQPWLTHLPPARSRAILVAVADYVAGGLERASMVEIVEGLWAGDALRPGMRVKTLRGAVEGVVLQLLPEHRVLWRPRGSAADLVAEAASLLPVRPASRVTPPESL